MNHDRILQDHDGTWIVQLHLYAEEARFVASAIRQASPRDSAADAIDRLALAADEANEEGD